jgi:hypothetical protein
MTVIHITRSILIICTVICLIVEIVALTNRHPGDTISEVVREWNRQSGGLLAYGLMALWLHFFVTVKW